MGWEAEVCGLDGDDAWGAGVHEQSILDVTDEVGDCFWEAIRLGAAVTPLQKCIGFLGS